MDKDIIATLTKQRIGITSNARDGYIKAIVDSALSNLKNIRGLTLEPDRADHLFFVASYAAWIYESKDRAGAMPAHLRLELNNLMMKGGV